MKNKNPVSWAWLAVCGLLPAWSQADDIVLAKVANLSFGTIEFAGSPATGNISMGTNGSVTYGHNTSGPGYGTPGQVQLDGPEGMTVSISCTATASLAQDGQAPLPVGTVVFTIGTGHTTHFVGGTVCTGIGTGVAAHSLSATASENMILVGGQLAIDGVALGNGSYSGSGSGGSQPVFQVLVE